MTTSPTQPVRDDSAVAQQAATSLGVPFTRIDPTKLTAAALKLIDQKLALEYRVIPLTFDPNTKRLVIAVADPSLLAQPAPAFLQQLKTDGYQLEIEITPPSDFEAAVAVYQSQASASDRLPSRDGSGISTKASDGQPPVAAAQPPLPVATNQAMSAQVAAATTQATPFSAAVIPPVAAPAVNLPSPVKPDALPSSVAVLPIAPKAPMPAATPVPVSVPSSVIPASAAQATQSATASVPASVDSAVVPAVSLGTASIPAAVLARFPADVARKYKMVVYKVSEDGKVASVGAVNPDDRRVREILKFVQERNNLRIELGTISQADLDRALAGYEQTEQPKNEPTKEPIKSTLPSTPSPISPSVQPLPKPRVEATLPKPPVAPPIQSDIKLASSDTIKAAVKQPMVTIAPAPAVLAGAPAIPSSKVGGVTPVQPLPTLQTAQAIATPSEPKVVQSIATQSLTPPTQPPPGDERNLDALLGSPITDPAELEQIVKTGMVPKIVAAIVSLAVSLTASDIHIEAARDYVRIRLRIDGELQEIIRVPIQLLAPLVSRLKILAKLKIDESRIPQDGRFDVWLVGREIDLRVSTLPTIFGEKVVLRILDKTAGIKSLEDLGIVGSNLARLRQVIDDPFGIILVSGPTGSGKTSTLYALLSELNRDGVNIVTLEDPVEYQLEGINQTQVKPAIGFGFADGLRSILRQDPNIVMVGEIRDQETAALATQAALTGHLVLSTLHTNDAAGAIPRMIDMGVEPFLLASSIKAVIGQRLVRRLDPNGAQPAVVTPEVLADIKQELAASKAPEVQQAASSELKFMAPSNGRASYHGRVGIYEVLTMSEAIADLTLKKAVASSIADTALKEGMVTMRQDGIVKALSGVTSLEEVLSATADK